MALTPVAVMGILAGGAAAANAAPATAQDAPTQNIITPGATGNITSYISNNDTLAHTAELSILWQAPAYSSFTSATVTYETSEAGQPYTGTQTLQGCTLSNNNTILTCPAQAHTIPASNGQPSTGRWTAPITVATNAPGNTTQKSPMVWSSNNDSEINSGCSQTSYTTPNEVPVPLVDPLIALGTLGLGAATLTATKLHRRPTT